MTAFAGAAVPAGQEADSLSLDDIVLKALDNNNMLRASKLKEEEMRQKVKEAEVKYYPSINLNSMYTYRFNMGSLSYPEGALGTFELPNGAISFPQEPVYYEIGKHNTVMAGASLYQPLSQLPKIRTGVKIAALDEDLANLEYTKSELQVINGVERLFYGILAVRKRKEETEKKIELIERRLYDTQSALLSGKMVDAGVLGMEADLSGKRQELLELSNEECDYIAELKKLTGADFSNVPFSDQLFANEDIAPAQDYIDAAAEKNVDLKISAMQVEKSQKGIEVAKQSYLPDIGLMAGYNYQNSIKILSDHNPYIGVSFKWNIQDVFSNSKVMKQRKLKYGQAQENAEYMRRSVEAEVEKAYRKMQEAKRLIGVAEQTVGFRRRNLEMEYDKRDAGLNTQTDVLEFEAEFAKAEADFYAAKQSYMIAQADMRMLTAATTVRR